MWFSGGLGEGQMWSVCNCFSYSSKAVCLGVCGGFFSLTCHVLGFSQWSLVHEELLVALHVVGSKVKNNLGHHLGDDILLYDPSNVLMSLFC